MSNLTTDNGLTISGNTGTTNIELGGSLNKYTTYIYNNGIKNNLGNHQAIWFGASGQTSLPVSGLTTDIVLKPLSAIRFTLSGSSLIDDVTTYYDERLPKTLDVDFFHSGFTITSTDISTGDTYVKLAINPLDLTVNGYVNGNLDTFFDVGQGQIQCQAGQGGMYIQSQGAAVFYSSSGASINMDVGDIFITADQYNTSASLEFKTSGITFFCPSSTGGVSITDNIFNNTSKTKASGRASFAMGEAGDSRGLYSFVGGKGNNTGNRTLLATGQTSFNFSDNDSTQTAGHGALAKESFILGGLNHNVPNTALRSGVIGGNAIKAANAVTDTVYMPKVRIGRGTGGSLSTLITGSTILGAAINTGEVGNIRINNGLVFTNGSLKFGGSLTGSTVITDLRTGLNATGIQYGANYSTNFTSRSLVDAGFVTGITSTLKNDLKGSFIATGTSTTVFTVTIGSTMNNTSYVAQPIPTSAIATVGHYVTNKTVTNFDVVYTLPITGPITFDWIIVA